jgi:hypothetical protein
MKRAEFREAFVTLMEGFADELRGAGMRGATPYRLMFVHGINGLHDRLCRDAFVRELREMRQWIDDEIQGPHPRLQ